jgi:hypothetical protein
MNFKSKINKAKHGLGPVVEAALASGLPTIRGSWFAVDPYGATDGREPKEYGYEAVYSTLLDAYNACTSGRGDGIAVLSGGTGTASHTTSYLSAPLAWTKHGITVFGVSAPTRVFGRARVASVTRTTGSLTTLAFATTTTITDSASGFLTAGFKVGDVLRVHDTGGFNQSAGHIITAVTAGTITCAASTFVVKSAALSGATVVSSYNANMIDLSGSNNTFMNLHVGNFGADALSVGCLKVSGHRNYFGNCHFIGAGHATPAATTGAYDLELNGGQENTFENCVFGTDTIIRGAANANIRFDTNVWRSRFYGCEILSYSATAGKGAIASADATALEGVQVFKECQFINWNENGIGALTSAFIGTKPTSGAILIDGCSLVGWAAWDSVGGNDMVYVVNSDATASGAGGIATTV